MSARQPAAAAGGGQASAETPGRAQARPGRRARRRWTGAGLVQAPGRLRSLVRRSEGGLVALATLVGCVSGIAVSAMTWVTQTLRELLYGLPAGTRLSAADAVTPTLLLVGPCLGGALLGLVILAAAYLRGPRKRPAIDPIEANALHGGRMSLRDSVYLALQNVISNGCGASVGLEAGYTQIASGLASRLGIAFEVRRSDLRTLVGCGAAGAIAAGFGAPLAGAFYAFELIIGTYSIATLTPVVVAALCGNLVSRSLIETQPLVDLGDMQAVTTSHVTSMEILPSLALGLVCAALGILIMRGVTLVERLVQASGLPRAAAPAFGGLCVGALALLATPQVLSGGHGALH
ncbi:MAG: chloride channel protein, partial [Hyphomicrobiales bacterium]